MTPDEIRALGKKMIDEGDKLSDEEAGKAMLSLLVELTAQTATIAYALTKGTINVEAKVREGSQGH